MSTDSVLVDGVTASLANTLQIVYTAAEATKITAVTAANTTGINASYKMNIVPVSGDITKPEIPFQVVTRFKSDPAPGVTNHVIPKGGTLRVETSAADSIAFRVTGIVLATA